jgi:hypothetical protein
VTNDGLEALARGCLKLEDFICKGCNQVLTQFPLFKRYDFFFVLSDYDSYLTEKQEILNMQTIDYYNTKKTILHF